jgi:hypothetical protein
MHPDIQLYFTYVLSTVINTITVIVLYSGNIRQGTECNRNHHILSRIHLFIVLQFGLNVVLIAVGLVKGLYLS